MGPADALEGEELSEEEASRDWTPQEKAAHEALVKAKAKHRIRRTSSRDSESADAPADLQCPLGRGSDRKSRMGKGRGLPKKGGAGGKGVWGAPGQVYGYQEPDARDPNYDEFAQGDTVYQKVVPELDEVGLQKNVHPMVLEYFEHGDTGEVIALLKELNLGRQTPGVARVAVSLSLEGKASHRELTSRLLSDLVGKVVTEDDIGRAFDRILSDLPDLILDTPEAPQVMGDKGATGYRPLLTKRQTHGVRESDPTECAGPTHGVRESDPTECAGPTHGVRESDPTECAGPTHGVRESDPTERGSPTPRSARVRPTERGSPTPRSAGVRPHGARESDPTERASPTPRSAGVRPHGARGSDPTERAGPTPRSAGVRPHGARGSDPTERAGPTPRSARVRPHGARGSDPTERAGPTPRSARVRPHGARESDPTERPSPTPRSVRPTPVSLLMVLSARVGLYP
ncbi:uncharacterized protein LOC142490686 [Ascaphus truei]|uniref:uncharacterized protein LOC142490686 n=1 Tax=Ascaphus truei TaxID=8439 RepID=UPI003F59E007